MRYLKMGRVLAHDAGYGRLIGSGSVWKSKRVKIALRRADTEDDEWLRTLKDGGPHCLLGPRLRVPIVLAMTSD